MNYDRGAIEDYIGRSLSDPEYHEYCRILTFEHAHEDIGAYRDYLEPTGHPDFIYPHASHHKIMARALERVESGEIKRLIVQLPPGSAKSTIVSVQFATWWWAKHPNLNILRCSATDKLAKNFSRRCLQAIMTPEWQKLSSSALNPKQQSVEQFATLAGGLMTAAGVGTSIIGLRSNLSILDDPVSSYEQVFSDTQRQAMIEWYFAEYRSRLVPTGSEIIVTTRWHPNDIVGHILASEEADTWTVIRIPMVCDSDNDPLGREIGDRLWPEWFTDQMVTEQQRDPLRWASMYQQVPLSDKGDFLGPDDFEIVDSAPKGLGRYSALDIAMTAGKGDFTVHLVGGMDDNGVLYIVDMFRDRVTPDNIVNQLVNDHLTYDLREILVDNDSGSKVFMSLAHKMLRERGAYVPIVMVPTKVQDKETRAMALRGLAKQGGIKLVKGNWNADFLHEVTEFPYGTHDDIVDAAALLCRRASRMSGASYVHKEEKPIKYAFEERDGRMFTTATLDELWSDNQNEVLNLIKKRI